MRGKYREEGFMEGEGGREGRKDRSRGERRKEEGGRK